MPGSRTLRRKRRKKRRRKFIYSFFILFFLSLVLYSGYEFMAGQQEAINRIDDHNNSSDNDQSQDQSDQEEQPDFKAPEQKSRKTNVLILGVDSRGEARSRTDTIIVGQYDPEHNTAKLASIMRDTYVDIPGYGYNKINAAFFFGGPELLRQTIKNNFGLDIHYYAIVDFQGFIHVVDTIAPDGVKINVEKRMKYRDGAGTINIDLYPGEQYLDGENLLDYARFRNDAEGDFGRVRRQQEVIQKLKDEFLSFSGIVKLPRIIGTLLPYVETNMKTKTILSLGSDYLLNPSEEIETLRIPVQGSFWNETYEHAGAVLAIDEEKNRQAVQEFFGTED